MEIAVEEGTVDRRDSRLLFTEVKWAGAEQCFHDSLAARHISQTGHSCREIAAETERGRINQFIYPQACLSGRNLLISSIYAFPSKSSARDLLGYLSQ